MATKKKTNTRDAPVVDYAPRTNPIELYLAKATGENVVLPATDRNRISLYLRRLIETLANKADINGYYAGMTVGDADYALQAKTIAPVSEESGTIQDAPFIAQGTGTANNTAIVDTSPIAKQLEKQGNTIVYNQYVDTDTTEVTITSGHKVYTLISGVEAVVTSDGAAIAVSEGDKVVDLTQWGFSADIITDLTSHPSHFSWYYNGSLAYNAGTLQNCNGRYLVCGQSRNLFDGTNDVLAIPSRAYYIYGTATVTYKDANGDAIGSGTSYTNQTFTTPSNCRSFSVSGSGSITISLYYSPEQGGEGYSQHYDYIAPKVYDTGTEPLPTAVNAKDTKAPDGTITHNIGTLAEQTGAIGDTITLTGGKADTTNVICSLGALSEWGTISGTTITLTKALSGDTIYYELATPNTEQGTPFSENIEINDYSYMAWLDENNALVSIPQGVKMFYPADYVLWLDTANARTNGDANSIALLSDIDDAALNARGYYKMQDLSNGITDNAGLTYLIKRLWVCGSVVTLTVSAQNSTGSTIPANTTLFTLPSSVSIGTGSVGFAGLVASTISKVIYNGYTGGVTSSTALANSDYAHIVFSFVKA